MREITSPTCGTPKREFLHVDDCADALVQVMKNYSDAEQINIGSGADLSILELAKSIAKVVGYEGENGTDPTKPDGTPRKLMANTKLEALGWRPRISLTDGLASTYSWYLENMRTQAVLMG